MIRDWFPERERGLVTTLFNGGSSAGPAIGALVAAALVSQFDWRTAFVALDAPGASSCDIVDSFSGHLDSDDLAGLIRPI
jgi:MFS family permease